jgi:nucleotide-binding universal stress UspA family protein
MRRDGLLLYCYDGSEDSRQAIASSAPLFEGRHAIVACFWQPFDELATRFARSLLEIVEDKASVNDRERALAEQTATEGAELARSLGVEASSLAVEASGPLDEAVLTLADEADAELIVLGSRGRSGLRSLLLGDVAADVLQHASRPVLVVPSPALGERRDDERSRANI